MRLDHALRAAFTLLTLGLATLPCTADDAPEKDAPAWPGMKRDGRVLLPNGWSLKPAGRQAALGDLPVALAENPTAPVLAVLHAGYGEHEVVTLDAASGKVVARTSLPETLAGLVWSADGKRLYVGGAFDGVVYRFDHAAGLLSNRAVLELGDADTAARSKDEEPLIRRERGSRKAEHCIGAMVLSKDGKTLWIADVWGHALLRVDAETGRKLAAVPLDAQSYPYGITLDEAAGRVFVSLWSKAEAVAVDAAECKVVARYATQEHPNEMLLAKGGKILYVANANRNTVTVVDLAAGKPIATIGTALSPDAPPGSTPNSLALTPDGSILFVANANTNDVAAFNVEDPAESKPLGFIPVGWYPTCVRVARDGKRLFVVNAKGASSKANRDGPNPLAGGGEHPTREYIGGLLRGTLSIVPTPGPREMAAYSRTVYECSPVRVAGSDRPTGPKPPAGNPIPAKVGDPSPIRHCIYIIKENRTYDQVFGDMPEGNGEPAICLFPERVTPNHHALAREYVLLDNFYVESEVSADGHEWSTAAYATDFVERMWPLSYRGDKRVPYPSEGALAIAAPAGGYLWDRAAAKGISYRSYGEFIDNGATPADPSTTDIPALKGHFDPKFRGYDLDYPDVKRAERFLEELAEFEKAGEMPRLIILRLPNDHTSGTRVGKPTVTAYVADNDLALGRLVEGVSRSRFWKETAIFVVEDDAQNGSDHVDAHRTVALAISPYTKGRGVDSTMYSTASMLRTMELILGLDPMSQFDAAARPMSNAFKATADATPYRVRTPGTDLKELNLSSAPGAAESEKLDLTAEDRADDLVFNEIIWKAVKGANSPMPPPVRAAFVLPREADGDDDDDGDEDDDD